MPLMTLQSNLSWYGTPGFQAAQNVEQTRFNYDPGDLTVAVAPRGFDNAGYQSNAFNINGQGTATRLTQLGEGTKFPIGPEGQTHEFDIKRTGFSLLSRYGDTFDNKSLKGLAATYTAASPIDDMYNKFKVRDEVYDPYGYAKTPFILKGIQKDGSSDPERWGMGTPGLDIPRGGITANAERTAADIERIGKFLIRPEGIAFIAKQNILRQMIPNIESSITIPTISGAVNKANPQRLYNPLNTMATVLGQSYGLRFRNFGLTPGDDGISKYEDVVTTKRGSDESRVLNNRLVTLRQERYISTNPGFESIYWKSISTLHGGPDSIGGLGGTLFTKSQVSLTLDAKELAIQPQYTYNTPYLYTHDNFNAYSNDTIQETIDARDGKAEITQYQSRPYYDLADIYSLINRTKKSLYQIGKEITNYTYPIKRGTTLPLTGLQTQLDFHKGEINKFGNAIALRQLIKTYDTPYIGTRTDTGITSDKISSIEDENKLTKRLKDKTPTESVANNKSNVPTGIQSYRTLAYANIPKEKERGPGRTSILEPNKDYTPDAVLAEWTAVTTPIARKLTDAQTDTLLTNDTSLIKFTIAGISFLAYLTNLSFDDQLGVDEKKELMAPFGQYVFSSLDRSVSVGFMLAARNQTELTTNWGKIKQLQDALAPDLGNGTSGVLRPRAANITIGTIYNEARVIIESVGYSIDTESPWDITKDKQYAYYITVDVQCKILPTSKTSLPTINIATGSITA